MPILGHFGMCILLILRNRVEGYPLVVGANRDEYRDRPWDLPRMDGDVLAPRDRRAGGTWIGVNRSGLLVAVTNRPEEAPDPSRPSRGLLAMDLLRVASPEHALDLLRSELARERRNALRVLVASADEAHVATHPADDDGGPVTIRGVPDGLHTLTNRRGLDDLDHRGGLDAANLPAASTLYDALGRLKSALALHDDRGPGGPDTICKHEHDRGTLSSTIIALPERAEAAPVVLMAPGAPCETPWEEFGMELAEGGPRPIE
jgi:Transport and Golgi organisation 2